MHTKRVNVFSRDKMCALMFRPPARMSMQESSQNFLVVNYNFMRVRLKFQDFVEEFFHFFRIFVFLASVMLIFNSKK